MKGIYKKFIQTIIDATLIVALLSFFVCPYTQAQNVTIFSSTDKFIIPEKNGSISFATNGSYSSATLQNGTWYFNDLTLYNSSRLGNLRVSIENSAITIYTYFSYVPFSQFSRFALIIYSVEEAGIQEFNLGLNNSKPTHPSEWGVILPDGTFLAEGKEWQLLPNDSVLLNGVTGNITIAHYGFDVSDDTNLPFYQQHSVALTTLAIVAVTVAIATLINYKARR